MVEIFKEAPANKMSDPGVSLASQKLENIPATTVW